MIRTNLQSLLLLLLTMTSGCVDSITFLSLGQVFAAAMTGNTVLFGLAVVHASSLTVVRYLMALCGFALGNAMAALICSRLRGNTGWNRTLTVALIWELGFLVASSILIDRKTLASPDLLILMFSAAMGIQGVVARRVGVNGITTTVITSTLTGMVESVVWNVQTMMRASTLPEKGANQSHPTPLSSIISWFAAIVTYGGGAAACGSIERYSLHAAVWLPVGIVSVVILISHVWQQVRARSQGLSQTGI